MRSAFACLTLVAAILTIAPAAQRKPLLLAHYMPWFQADAAAGKFGWHWTMNHFDPKEVVDGNREIASHYHPLIGPYDSDDPAVITYEVMLMKLAGIDGVLIDWYGTDDLYDYADNQRRTLRMIKEIKRAHMKFAIVYEDQTVQHLIDAHKLTKENAVEHVNAMFRWADRAWFHDPDYVKIDGRPLLLVFGPQYFKYGEWPSLFRGLKTQPAFFTEMKPQGPAIGGFDWPYPHDGDAGSARSVDQFFVDAKGWRSWIAAAFPRFDDIYAEAKISPSWGHVSGDQGRLYGQLLERAIRADAPVVQLVTWNDWGEGTQIEPSKELRYQDLQTTQKLRKELIDPKFSRSAADLEMAYRWYQLHLRPIMTAVPGLVYEGNVSEAARIVRGAYR